MREIKSRALIQNGEWDEKSENQAYEMCYDLAFEEYEPINDLLAGVEYLMQYTELKDKNSKEIYEGDIVAIEEFDNHSKQWEIHHRLPVEYYKGSFCFIKGRVIHTLSFLPNHNEVIGNIYENPELSKEMR